MSEQTERIYLYIKNIFESEKSDDEIKFDIDEMIGRSCNYIQNSKFPITCERTLARELAKLYSTDTQLLGVTSIKEGQTSVTFDKPIDYDSVLENMKSALNPFRRLPMEQLLND